MVALKSDGTLFAMGRRRPTQRKVVMIRYYDPDENVTEMYPLDESGHHATEGLSPRSVKGYTRSLPIRAVLQIPDIASYGQRTPAPPVFEGLPLLSSMWLNNPEYIDQRT